MVLEYLNNYKEEFKKCINDLKHRDTFYKQIPNLLTFSRAVGMIPVNILFFTGNSIAAIILIMGLLTTDFFDGKIARKYNIQSKFGADLDAMCDKFMFLGLVLPLLVGNPIMSVNLVFEGLIAGVNVLGRMNKLDTKTVYTGKIKTCFLSLTLLTGYLVKMFNVPVSLLNSLVTITSLSQGVALGEYIYKYNEMKKNKLSFEVVKDIDDELVEIQEDNERDNMLEELKKEREFLMYIKEADRKPEPLKRARKIEDEKKNNN